MSSNQPAIDYSNPRHVIVTFAFSQGWQIISPYAANGFPGGGGLEPPTALKIDIAPLDLASMTAAQARAAIARRATDLGKVAQALALAQAEFASALEQYAAPESAG